MAHGPYSRGGDTVVFNVGGRKFEVFRHTIESHPSTLLGILLDDITSANTDGPIFVDANPDRFAHVLDWYRYGEIFLAGDTALAAVLRDARYFMLSDVVTVNGQKYSIAGELGALGPLAARQVDRNITDSVLADWPSFEDCVSDIISELEHDIPNPDPCQLYEREHEYAHGRWQHSYLYSDFCIASIWESSCEWVWREPNEDINSQLRLSVMLAELRRRGFECSVRTRRHFGSSKKPDPSIAELVRDPSEESDLDPFDVADIVLRVGIRLGGAMDTVLTQSSEPFRVVMDGTKGCLAVYAAL